MCAFFEICTDLWMRFMRLVPNVATDKAKLAAT